MLAAPNALYVMRNARHEVVRVRLEPDWASGEVEERITDARLQYPSTAALSAGGLMVVNPQLDRQKNPPVRLPFDIVTLDVAPR